MPTNLQRRHARELREATRAGYEAGSKATLLSLYTAIAEDAAFGLDGVSWLSALMQRVPSKLDAATVAEVEKQVTLSIIAHMRSYSPTRAAEVEKSFADFLAGSPAK